MPLPLPHDAIPYMVLLCNCLLFKSLRLITFRFVPCSWKLLVSEIISTLELCSGCAELGVVYEIHGMIGLGISIFLVCMWWCQVFDDAEACPCGPIEDLLFPADSAIGDILKKITGQVIGAVATAGYIKYVWSFHMVPEHEALHTSQCQAGLQVTPLWGAWIEGYITAISRIVALESIHWSPMVSSVANSATTSALVLWALNTTGGFFNPILASALTLGCTGNTHWEHFLVYWLGALLGGFVGRYIHTFLEKRRKFKFD